VLLVSRQTELEELIISYLYMKAAWDHLRDRFAPRKIIPTSVVGTNFWQARVGRVKWSTPPKAAAKTAGSGDQDCDTQLYSIRKVKVGTLKQRVGLGGGFAYARVRCGAEALAI